MSALEPQEALVHLMLSVAISDGAISQSELRELGALLGTLPVFEGFDRTRLETMADHCRDLLSKEDGIDHIVANVRTAVPPKLYETAYALAVEVVASDTHASQSELRYLELIRDELELDRLIAGAIEHSARVRYRKL